MVHEVVHFGRPSANTDDAGPPGAMAHFIAGRFARAFKDLGSIRGTTCRTPRGTTRCATKWSTIAL